jgi:hypothetical protein
MEYKQKDIDTSFYVDKSALALFPGDTEQLTASPADLSFEWEIEDPSVAKVSATGLVEAVGAGATHIVVSSGDLLQTIPVTVKIPSVDRVIAKTGKERVLMELYISLGRIKNVRITRNDTNASEDIAIDYQTGVFQYSFANLPEATYTFSIVSFDRFDNPSVPIEITAKTMGDIYESQLKNRSAKGTLLGNGLVIAWGTETLMDAAFCELSYTNKNGAAVTTRVPINQQSSYLYDYSNVSGMSYTTWYASDLSIDTFLVANELMTVDDKLPVLSDAGPCTILAANFDLGGEGVGFHDLSNRGENNAPAARTYRKGLGDYLSLAVDVPMPELAIGYGAVGEWLAYTVEVKTAGNYVVDLETAVANPSARYHLTVDDVATPSYTNVGGSYPNYIWYYTVYPAETPPVLNLTQGTHQIKYYFDVANNNLRNLRFTKQ